MTSRTRLFSSPNFGSLTWQQAIRVMLAALILGAVIYSVEVFLLVKTIRAQTIDVQKQVLDLAESPSATAAWNLDERLANDTLQGILSIDLILEGKITLSNGEVFAQVGRASINKLSNLEVLFANLFNEQTKGSRALYGPDVARQVYGKQQMALLELSFDKNLLTKQFVNQININLFASLIRSLLLALVLGIVFHRFLTRPIVKIGDKLKLINPDAPESFDITLPIGHKNGELNYLIHRFNETLKNLSASQKDLRKLATRDTLTQLPNRALINEELMANIARARLLESSFSVLIFDLDRFKSVNDTMGHTVGDQLLCILAQSLTKQLPLQTRVGRLGGDEFVVISEFSKNTNKPAYLAEKILSIVNQPVDLIDLTLEPACSIGIALYPKDGETVEALLRHADIAMYTAKKRGINQVAFFSSEMKTLSTAQFKIETQLRHAIEKKELLLYYQPKFSAQTEKIIGCEALLRWDRKDQIMSPAEFIPVAEETEMIVPIGYWVLEEACRTIQRWKKNNQLIKLAINVSPVQLRDTNFLNEVRDIVIKYPHCAEHLEFEITESSLMTNLDKSFKLFESLKTMGISISIDDFGTGYSSLAYLRRLDLNTLKIDRTFVVDIPHDTVIPASILALANQLGLKTVAEGVETYQQLSWLQANGCDMIQGYYYSPPLPLDEFEQEYLFL